MINIIKRNILVFLFIMLIIYVDNFLFGQNTGDYSNKTGISSLLKVNTGSSEQYNQAIKGIRRSIDEEQYTIDTGDEFLVKIDIPGPEIQTITVPVLSDGYILITESEGIYIRGMKLKDAKKTITEHLKRYLPNALTECYLNAIHPVKVSIKGALEINQLPEFTSADRISDIIDFVYGTYKQDTLLLDILKSASLRNISVIRNDTTILFDYLIYKSSNKQVNQYLKDNDVIFIPYKDTCGFTIQVDGMVGHPIEFEYKNEDKLSTAITLSGGILPTADSARIEVYRFNNIKGFDLITLSIPRDTSYLLVPDDRIYVRRKAEFHEKSSVYIKGEVRYPGIYPIIENRTTLSELIKTAGGFTDNASIKQSRIIRDLKMPGINRDTENILPQTISFNWIESNYFRFYLKENLTSVTCDWGKLFIEKDYTKDVLLRNMDIIEIPLRNDYVYVTGSVSSPGTIAFNQDYSINDYINAAGGFKARSKPSRIKIIKNDTETWQDVKDTRKIEPGDRIFVPQKNEQEPWQIFMQGLTVLSQVATIVLIITSY